MTELDGRTTRGWVDSAENRTAVGWLFIAVGAVRNIFVPKFIQHKSINKVVPTDLD